jgi:hypothetical protein
MSLSANKALIKSFVEVFNNHGLPYFYCIWPHNIMEKIIFSHAAKLEIIDSYHKSGARVQKYV